MGGAAIGGGEWLLGPIVTARYGGAVLWLATLSILFQVVYNLEISRYTLYSGEPIFTGKFRMPPGPWFWLFMYLMLDFGSVFPYLAASAATPMASVVLGRIPDVSSPDITHILGIGVTDQQLVKSLSYLAFLLALLPLVFGGKVYNSLKAVMSFKIVFVLGFLGFMALFYSTADTWIEIISGFFKFGTVPIESDGPQQFDNVFIAIWEGRGLPAIDYSMVSFIAAMAAIAGSGGLTNTSISGYTRDQGWGMGHRVGAIPSIIGGHRFSLSHVGMVFPIDAESVGRFRRWRWHVLRDQLVIWMPACFLGLALPSMLSVQFLPRGSEAKEWTAAGMTADGVAAATGPMWGPLFWYLTLSCGFLVLLPSAATTADGFLRRWVDVFWTASPRLRDLDPHKIRNVYYTVLCCYALFGITALTLGKPTQLIAWATTIYNYALGFSCWHTLAANLILLPPQLRPGWFQRIAMILGGAFFTALAVITTLAARQ